MECSSDGQIIRAKELDTSFKIPKKQQQQCGIVGDDAASNQQQQQQQQIIEPQSILNDSNNQQGYDPLATYAAWSHIMASAGHTNYYQYYNNYNLDGNINMLKRLHEAPKNTTKTYLESFGDLGDATLPQELREQFQPLYCKLCSVQLGSSMNARLHYASKNHDKKVRRYLMEFSMRTGEPLHKRARLAVIKKVNEPEVLVKQNEYDPRNFHCDICDLPLTGKAHADSHYNGKNHQKVLSGKKAPAGQGYYNSDGKFVRILKPTSGANVPAATITAPAISIPSPTDSFGLDFIQSSTSLDKATSLRCELCQVSVTSLPQMDMHLQGQRHQKNLRIKGLLPAAANNNNSYDSHTPISYSSYRTPSGQYYCKVCDISLNGEAQIALHLQGKSHKKKSLQVKD